MRVLHVDLSVPEGCAPDEAAKLRRVWATHAGRGQRDGWAIVFDAQTAAGAVDAVLSVPLTSWVHWNALFAFIEKGGSGAGPGGLSVTSVSSVSSTTDGPKSIPCLAYDRPGGDAGALRLGFDEGDACEPWDVFAVRASVEVSFLVALIHSALYVRNPRISLPELAGEAAPHFDDPAALFEQ